MGFGTDPKFLNFGEEGSGRGTTDVCGCFMIEFWRGFCKSRLQESPCREDVLLLPAYRKFEVGAAAKETQQENPSEGVSLTSSAAL